MIQNIHEERVRQAINDNDLQEAVKLLAAGDVVKLTFLTDDDEVTGESMWVEITSIRDDTFRGELANVPVFIDPAKARLGMPLEFRAEHIHSIWQSEI